MSRCRPAFRFRSALLAIPTGCIQHEPDTRGQNSDAPDLVDQPSDTFQRVCPSQEPGRDSAGASKRRLRVLVVDDQPDAVTTLLALLRAEGHEARGHGSGAAALAAFQEFRPDVVISDLAMPSLNGWALASEITNMMGNKRPVLIAITGQYTKSEDKVLSHTSGFHFYLTKPADPEVILKLVASGNSEP